MRLPRPIEELVQYFRLLPGVGPKTATRYALALLKQDQITLDRMARAIGALRQAIQYCTQCYNFSLKNPCDICGDPERDQTILCIVAKPQDLYAIENSGAYRGRYHILHGTLSPLEGVTPDQLKINELEGRLVAPDNTIAEMIIGFNPDMEGEATSMYLNHLLRDKGVKITRLARGLPTGGDVEYADELTLASALEGRKEV